jgi:hypothetical protein
VTHHVSHFFLDVVSFSFLFIPFGLYPDLQIRWKTQYNTIGSKGIEGGKGKKKIRPKEL